MVYFERTKVYASWFQSKMLFKVLPYLRMWENVANFNLDQRGLIGRVYVGDYYTLRHTKYINYICLIVMENNSIFLKAFLIISLCGLYDAMATRAIY